MPRLLPQIWRALRIARLDDRPSFPADTTIQPKRRVQFPEEPLQANLALPREKSVLLDSVNPILHPNVFKKHKRPVRDAIFTPTGFLNGQEQDGSAGASSGDIQTRQYWKQRNNPYQLLLSTYSTLVRMLASPLRRCTLTTKRLPSNFLIRLSTSSLRSREGPERIYLLPDGLQHPKYLAKTCGRGSYVLCWKDALRELTRTGALKRIHSAARVHSLLLYQIGHQLRMRALQELELLVEAYSQFRKFSSTQLEPAPLVSRLTRVEWLKFRRKGVIPLTDPNVILIIILPRVPKGPDSGGSEPSETTPTLDVSDRASNPLHRPVAALHPLFLHTQSNPEHNLPPEIPQHLVPVYNGVTLFPSRDQRLAFRILLQRQFSMEQSIQKSQRGSGTEPTVPEQSTKGSLKLKPKYSDAYVLRSPSVNSRAVPDVTPLAIACWRVRMWEGEAWERQDQSENDCHWFESVESRQQLHAGLRRVRHPRWSTQMSR